MPELVSKGYKGVIVLIKGKQATCRHCGATVRFTEEDARKAKYQDDQRDGNYYSLTWNCPDVECDKENTSTFQIPTSDPASSSSYYGNS